MIYYYCPDFTTKSAGIRILYRHVEVLNKFQIPAAILHEKAGFYRSDMPAVTVRHRTVPNTLHDGDIVVIPEGTPHIMLELKSHPLRRIGIALNWLYIYKTLPDKMDWRSLNIERVLTHSPFIADFVNWAMGLPTHVTQWAINDKLYFETPAKRALQVTYIKRKEGDVDELKRVLGSRNRAFVENIRWDGLDGLSEQKYAAEIRSSSVFLNLSPAEGLPCSLLEAMRAGTLVAGFNSVGGQRELVGEGSLQNCVLAENLDYVTLARRLEPVLQDMLAGNMDRWSGVRENARVLSQQFTEEAEEASIIAAWREILGK